MRTRPSKAALRALLVILLALAIATAAGCGGSDTSESVTYRNSEYRFSLTHPGAFEQFTPPATSFMQGIDFTVGFGDMDTGESAAESGDYIQAVIVGATSLPSGVTSEQKNTAIKQMLKQYRALAENASMGGYSDASVTTAERTQLNGMDGLYVEMTVTNPLGKREHDAAYLLFGPQYLYLVQVAVPEAAWESDGQQMLAIAESLETW